MDNSNQNNRTAEGRLPAMAPLANPYVPFQLENPPRYEPAKAFVRGTLFPGLDLPFMGMVNKNQKPVTPLTELQTLAFAISDLAIYLDTHKNDREALEVYRGLQALYEDGRKKYEAQFGPLTHMTVCDGAYRWLDDPWPWEYAHNKEA